MAMNLDQYKLDQLTTDLIEATKQEWGAEIERVEDQINPERYRGVLRDLAIEPNADGLQILALVSREEEKTVALLKVTRIDHGRHAPRVKVLDVYMNPGLDLDAYTEVPGAVMRETLDVCAAAISHCLLLIFGEDPANELKMYCRSDEMFGYLGAVATILSETNGIDGLDISYHAHWLIFKKTTS